jgi:tetratricopeptide (TPR) repeat protein
MKRVAGFLVAVGMLFAAVTVLKRDSGTASNSADSTVVSAEERDRIRRFWDTYRRATDRRVAGQSQEAADEYTRALALEPEHRDALYYLGNMEFDLGNLAAAEQAWQRLIEIDPTSARAHSQLGMLYFCVGEEEPLQHDRAVAEFQRAAAINREETGPLLSLGEIALVQEDMETALDYFDAVIGSNYSSVEAHFYKGYIAWKSGAPAQASELLAAATHHARPSAPTGDVPGEGDTRAGTAPMVRAPTRCGAMRAHVDELAGLDAEVTRHVGPVYRAFDELLQEVRKKLP